MISERKINNISVVPVQTGMGDYNKSNLKGYSIFPYSPYFTTFIVAKKKSGKSSLINTLLRKTTDKRTVIWIFCSTYQIDPTWIEIIKFLKQRGNLVNCFHSIMNGKENQLQEIIKGLENDDDSESEVEDPKEKFKLIGKPKIKFQSDLKGDGKPKKEYRPKKKACENMFVFDDLSTELKLITPFLKVHRHLLSSCLISSQYLHDLEKSGILQLDFLFAFKGLPIDKVEYIHTLLDLSIDLDTFIEVYRRATQKPYSFLYCDIRKELFRENLNVQLSLDY